MPELDCSKHVIHTKVTLNTTGLQLKRELIAGLIREIAFYTGGECATRNATDDSLVSPAGMRLWFTSFEADRLFQDRLRWYLHPDVYARLTVV